MPAPLQPAERITEENIRLDPESGNILYDAEAAIKIVLEDTNRSDTWMNFQQWPAAWTLASLVYQSPLQATAFEGGSVARANVPRYTLSNHISAIVPKIMGGLFYEDPPFLLRPRPGTSQDVMRAKTALFSYQLDDMKFEEECERALLQMALFGTCIMKWGWMETVERSKRYKLKTPPARVPTAGGPAYIHTPESDEFEVTYEDTNKHRPWIKACDIRTVLVDSGCRVGDIRTAKFVIYRDYPTYRDLEALRGVEGYTIPSEDELKKFFFRDKVTPMPDNLAALFTQNMIGWLQTATPRFQSTTSDPAQDGLEILERWDDEKVMVVLRHGTDNILIRNEANPFSKIPFYSANWRDIVDSFYGQGLGILIGAEQIVEQGVINLALDLLAYGLQPTAIRKKGFNAPTQQIRWKQGGIIEVDDDVDKAFKFLQMPPVPAEAWTAIQAMQASSQATSGANEQVMLGAGAPGIKTTGMRSGTGANLVGAANASRLDGPSSRFVRQIFVPWLYQMDELNNDRLPASVLRQVLSEEMQGAMEMDHVAFRNAKMDFEVLAGAHLGPKREMSQFLPFIVQLINNPTFESMIANAGYKFDAVAVFKAFTDASGWRYSQNFLVPMSPQERQQNAAQQPAAIQQQRNQGALQQQTLKFQQDQQMEDTKQLGKASNEVLRVALEHAMTSEAGGTEPQEAFGGETGL